MSNEQTKEKVKEFILQYLGNHDLREDDDIFALGMINSMFAMQLVMFVEQEFDIAVENDDLDIDNFSSINAIAYLVERKTAVAEKADLRGLQA